MRVAVNARFLLRNYLEGYGNFINEIFPRIAKKHSSVEFIFIFDRKYDKKFLSAPNIRGIVAGPPARHPLLWKLWYDVKIPIILKKIKADVFVSCDGFCSLSTKIPQCLVIHDLAFLHYPSGISKSYHFFYKKFTPKFLDKAKQIITVSEFSKNDLVKQYNTDPQKISIVHNGVKNIFSPVSNEKKEEIKKKYTEGREYFVYAGSIHPRKNLFNLLKAFSVIKKRQQTNMKLVLSGRPAWKYEPFIESLKNYKYKNDVVVTGYMKDDEFADILGSAYSMLYVSFFEGFGVPVLEAMKCEVPVITSVNSAMNEISKGAALYADPNDFQDIADKMMLLYKDEKLRKELIQKGQSVAAQYSWDKSADLFWNSIMNTIR